MVAGRVPRWRSLGSVRPDLATELDPSRNGKLDAYSIAAGSDRKLWWRCGEGHAWHASVAHRARGRGCPVCAPARAALADQARRERALRAAPERSLAVRHPELVAELHPARSADLDPRLLSVGSSRSVWWLCACGHEWRATVSNRSRGAGCPACARRSIRELNARVAPERSLAVRHPELVGSFTRLAILVLNPAGWPPDPAGRCGGAAHVDTNGWPPWAVVALGTAVRAAGVSAEFVPALGGCRESSRRGH